MFCLAHRDVDAKALEQHLVLGIVDTGDRTGDVKLGFGHLADDKIVLVLAGDRDDDIGALRSGLAEHRGFRAIARQHDRPQSLAVHLDLVAVSLDQKNLVALDEERLGEVVPNLSATYNNNVHSRVPRRRAERR